jgi:hypothetical protein
MWRSDVLTVSPMARTECYQTLTAYLLPPQLRLAFGFRYGEADRLAARRVIEWIRQVYPILPDRLRYVGPYQEAHARMLRRAQPDLVTQALNLLWIGQRRLSRLPPRRPACNDSTPP